MTTDVVRSSRQVYAISFLLMAMVGIAAVLLKPIYVLGFAIGSCVLVFGLIKTEWMLYSLIVASLWSMISFEVGPATVRVDQVFTLIGMSAILMRLLSGMKGLVFTRLDPFIAIYWLCNVLSSALNSPDRSISFQSCLLLLITFCAYFVTTQLIRNRKILMHVLFLLIVAGVLEAIYGIASVFLFVRNIDIKGAQTQFGNLYARGTFLEGNLFGCFEMIVALVLVSFFFSKYFANRKIIILIALVTVLVGMLMSFTRSAWIGFMIGFLVYLMIQRPLIPKLMRRFPLLVLAFVLIVVVGFVVSFSIEKGSQPLFDVYKERLQTAFQHESGTGWQRITIWTESIRMWRRHPYLGNGTDALKVLGHETLLPFFGAEFWISNSLILALHDTGLVGLFVFCAIQMLCFLYLWRAMRRANTALDRAILGGLLPAFAAAQFASLFTNAFWLIFIWVFTGTCVSAARLSLMRAEATGLEEDANRH